MIEVSKQVLIEAGFERILATYPHLKNEQKKKETVKEMLSHYITQYIEAEKEGGKAASALAYLNFIDERIESYKKIESSAKKIKCAEGCTYCCYIAVTTSIGEAQLLLLGAKRRGVKLDKTKLEKQAKYTDETYHELGPKDASCVFLKDNECQIYEHRPMSCRVQMSLDDPKLCWPFEENSKVTYWRPIEIEVIAVATAMVGYSDYMAKMLLKEWKLYEDKKGE